MSSVAATLHGAGSHAEDAHHEHHHHETFISKYVFSQDHKMIAKQFLVTGMIWAFIGGLFSVIFRIQLGYPDSTFPWLEDILGHWAEGGRLKPEFYYAMVTMHGTILVFFVYTSGCPRNQNKCWNSIGLPPSFGKILPAITISLR